jgi:glutamate N-acetyltransferase/amino-acid N-acetyltransferase
MSAPLKHDAHPLSAPALQREEPAIMRDIPGGVTAPRGYRAAGVHCGVKKLKKDLCLLVSDAPAAAAAVLTTNIVQAAPVVVVRQQLLTGPSFRAIVVNSGNANACTGERGLTDAWAMTAAAARALGVENREVLVSSTGVIGQFLPMDRILDGITLAARNLSRAAGGDAAEAIMTTDTFVKEAAVRCELGGKTVTVGGMAKGSGMIAPNMATMLAFVTTDAAITPPLLRAALAQATGRSFNRISVDGDMSTNDMAAVLANGMAGAPLIADAADPSYQVFCSALEHVLVRLSKMIVVDGEGATKFIEITVTGAATEADATAAGRAIANSNLVKTAMHGEDANWGRILAAAGTAGIPFDPAEVEIWFGDVPILRRNYRIDFSEDEARKVLEQKEIRVTVALHQGEGTASFWTCDLSKEYVTINANYRT